MLDTKICNCSYHKNDTYRNKTYLDNACSFVNDLCALGNVKAVAYAYFQFGGVPNLAIDGLEVEKKEFALIICGHRY